MRWLITTVALGLSAGCAGGRPVLARSWIVGKPLDLGAVSLDGDAVAVGGADGTVRVVILWATWCKSCFQLFPALDVLAEGDSGRGLSVRAISVDEDLARVREAAARIPERIQVLWDRGAERVGERLGVEELPTLIVIDRRGNVRFVREGTDERLVEQVDGEVRRLLQE